MRFVFLAAIGLFIFSGSAKANCDLGFGNGTRPVGTVVHNTNYDVLQVCRVDGTWQALGPLGCPTGDGCGNAPDPCAGSPSLGTTCADGTIYAGLTPDGNVKMYTTPADAPTLMSWNDGSSNWVDTAMANCDGGNGQTSCHSGSDNTALLAGLGSSPSPSPYVAANYCNNLVAHGKSDWYLPADMELRVLYINRNSGALAGTFNDSPPWPDSYYWSSSEAIDNPDRNAINYQFANNTHGWLTKSELQKVRCVRKD